MIPRRVWLSVLLASLCHGLFIVTARYRLSYDAYTHMLFANHYAESWFSLWEPRWYAGFTVVSYPPLTDQLIALFIPILGVEKAFAFILWVVASLYPLGVFAFSRIFTGKTSSTYAALASAILLPVYVTAHIFGQLPFLAGTLLALLSAASLNRYLREGGPHNLLLTVSLYAATMASHHASLMVHPFLSLAVLAGNAGRVSDVTCALRVMVRLLFVGVLALVVSFLVIFPFWQWGAGQSMQTPIDHLSRHDFLADPLALAIFFFPLYGPLVGVIPFLIRKWPPRFTGLLVSFIVLFLLGLGGTTPLPRLVFGTSWEWLTYDRFAFWACLTLTPFFGVLFIGLKKRQRLQIPSMRATPRRNLISALTFSLFAATSLGAWFTPYFLQLQPDPIRMQPILDFLNIDHRSDYRYVTFGFGDQFAYLNLLSGATTIDGSYHTARTLPELRESGIGQIDTVYWTAKGIPAIEPILKKSGEYGVRWGFVNPATLQAVKIRWGQVHRSPFIPFLDGLGWKHIQTLSNEILVFENPNAKLPGPVAPTGTSPITSFAWGVFPLLSLVNSLSLGALRIAPVQAEKALRGVHAFLAGLIPLSLCFWYYRLGGDFPHERVYFTYTDALFFLTDAVIVLTVVLWLSVKISNMSLRGHTGRVRSASRPGARSKILLEVMQIASSQRTLLVVTIILLLLASFSLLWSRDWRTSFYISLHVWLVFLLILSLRDWRDAWRPALYGFCAALSIQLIAGFIGFGLQSTAFLDHLSLKWPGVLDPSVRGASVVQLSDGLRILRAYGTLPHPNILGGFVLLSLLGPAGLFLVNKVPNYAALMLFSLGVVLMVLTFSRSAWLGSLASMCVLILKLKYLHGRRLFLLVAVFILTAALTLFPLRDQVFTRISNATVATEQLSAFGRSWLTEQALDMIRQHPLAGVGVGSFIIELSMYAIEGAPIEPAHNIFLLAGAELGIPGLLLFAGLFLSVGMLIFKARTPQAILVSATLAGLGIISLFDHYLWTIAPGRLMLGLALGLWAGQVTGRDS